MEPRKRFSNYDLLKFDWDRLKRELEAVSPNDDSFYMIVINKGKDDEFRTRFLTHKEAMETVCLAIEKQKLHLPITL